MEQIQKLIAEDFALFNVSDKKAPVNRYGHGMADWINKTNEELKKEHNYQSKLWGMKMGNQENGRKILSLDFDICGKKNQKTGHRVGCPETKKKWEEYCEHIDKKDGCFSSSTEGNFNVLVDYTNSKIITDIVMTQGNKTKYHELEILFGGNQVIPPSQTMCKINQQIGKPRQFLNEEMFYILPEDQEESFLRDFILGLLKEEEVELNKTTKLKNINKPPTYIVDNNEPENHHEPQEEDKYLNLLFNVIKNERDADNLKIVSRDDWFQICGILKHNGYDKKIWLEYSGTISKTTTASKTWDGIKTKKTFMYIYGLQNLAKKYNPDGYKDWKIKYNQYLKLEILDRGENEVAKYISERLKKNVKYCNDNWYVFDFETGLWRMVKKPDAFVISHLQREIDEAREILLRIKNTLHNEEQRKKIEETEKKYFYHFSKVGNRGYCGQLLNFLTTYLYEGDFIQELDDHMYYIAFKNGMLDLKTLKFREGIRQDDYLTKTIPFDYKEPSEEETKIVRTALKKTCNWNEEHLDYYLSTLGYAMTGDSNKEQYFWYLRGQTAENGKSLPFEILEKIMPNYVLKATNNILDKGVELKKEIPTWKGLRILWLNEVSTKPKDDDLAKSICDGTDYKYNRNYAVEAEKVKIGFKLFAVSNNSLNIKGDSGVERRFRMEQFSSQFKETTTIDDYEKLQFVKDKTFGDKLSSIYKYAFLHLIFEYSKKYYEEKKLRPYPVDWKEEAKENMLNNDKFREFFEAEFVMDEEGTTSKKTIEDMLPNELKYFNIKDEITRLQIKFIYKSQERIGRHKGVFKGFRIKTLQERENEENV